MVLTQYFIFSVVVILTNGEDWNSIRTTFQKPVEDESIAFASMPLTMNEAEEKGFARVTDDSGSFAGARYSSESDTSVVLIYDKNGFFAGIQSVFPIDEIKETGDDVLYEWFTGTPYYVKDNVFGKEALTATVYYTDPNLLNGEGRTEEEFKANKVQKSMFIQSGPDYKENLISVPLEESSLDSKWTKGGCFEGMGNHYWLENSKDMDCKNLVTVFLLYSEGKMAGFGFATFGKFENSPRYEHLPTELYPNFFGVVPDCVYDYVDKTGGASGLHVYVKEKPQEIKC